MPPAPTSEPAARRLIGTARAQIGRWGHIVTSLLHAGVVPFPRVDRGLAELVPLVRHGTTMGGLFVAAAVATPGRVAIVDDDEAVTYVVCVDSAPCGKLAAGLLGDAGITHEPASLEVDVKAVLAKVTTDEADAGVVYASDAVAAGDAVRAFDIEGASKRRNVYPIGTLEQSDEADLAAAFVDLVLSADGQEILADAGFGPSG